MTELEKAKEEHVRAMARLLAARADYAETGLASKKGAIEDAYIHLEAVADRVQELLEELEEGA